MVKLIDFEGAHWLATDSIRENDAGGTRGYYAPEVLLPRQDIASGQTWEGLLEVSKLTIAVESCTASTTHTG
jgi:hypothetical protein